MPKSKFANAEYIYTIELNNINEVLLQPLLSFPLLRKYFRPKTLTYSKQHFWNIKPSIYSRTIADILVE